MSTKLEFMRATLKQGKLFGFWLGIALFFLLLILPDFQPGQPEINRMAAVALLMAAWWLFDAIPLAATALLPLVLFPLLGIMTGKETAPVYVNYIIFLYLGGFLIALAMERWNLHKRIALSIIRVVGGGPDRLVLSFMLATAFLSMWISNTATSIMMLAIGLAIISQEEAAFGKERTRKLSVALLLGIAYSASVGGMATLVGTPPNLSLVQVYDQTFPDAPDINFGQWMLLGIPISVIMLGIIWLLLTKVFFASPADLKIDRSVIHDEHAKLGRIKYEEWVVLSVFVVTAVLWVTRADLRLGNAVIPGWSSLIPNGSLVDDGTIAVGMALLLFFFPVRSAEAKEQERKAVLEADVFKRLPWNIVLLFGGGFALAKGFTVSGLSAFIGDGLAGLQGLPTILVIAIICLILTFLTELTSNTATTQMVLPILASVAITMGVHPLLLMAPAALSASCAFMMPVATPPNAIVFGSGHIQIGQMARVGVFINLIGVIVITLLFYFVGTAVLGIDLSTMPDWAQPAALEPSTGN